MADYDDEAQTQRLTPGRITALAVIAAGLLVAGAIAVGGYTLTSRQGPIEGIPQTTLPSAAKTPAASAPPLDGVYRVVYDSPNRTQTGAAMPSDPSPADTNYWAFRTSCADACVARGVRLTDESSDKPREPAAGSPILRFVDGRWREDPAKFKSTQTACIQGGTIAPGQEDDVSSWVVEPGDDGAFSGHEYTTALSNECGFAGAVTSYPVTMTRIRDVPASLSIPDPAQAPPLTAVETTDIQDLNGVYKLTFKLEAQTVNGMPVSNPLPDRTEAWAFRSACSTTKCVATAAQVLVDNPRQNTGLAKVLTSANGEWRQDVPTIQPAVQCANGPDSESYTVRWSVVTQVDQSIRGVQIGAMLSSACGNAGSLYKTPIAGERIGDVATSVVIADPMLFLAK